MNENKVEMTRHKQNLNFRKLSFPDNLLATLLEKDDTEYQYNMPYDHSKLKQNLLIILAVLSEREEDMILLRYKEQQTYEQIGLTYGITKERVRRIINNGIRTLKSSDNIALVKKGLDGFIEEKINRQITDAYTRGYEQAMSGVSASENTVPAYVYNLPIEELGLSTRAFNCLKRSRINTVNNMLTLKIDDIFRIRAMGYNTAIEVAEKLQALHIARESDWQYFIDNKTQILEKISKKK